MPKKRETTKPKSANPNVVGLKAAVREQQITDTLEVNYMPYAMSVIVSRAIPEIDGFKPSHRKLLYTMYKMGLLTGGRTKSANIVGQTMRLNPHGDSAIYDTMVRLSRGCESLLAPFVDSKGNFGKVYSRDMASAASRYTEAKLSAICAEVFRDIDRDTVDFVDNYDGSMKEPVLLPTTFPNVLVSANMGIAVGMASNICGFNITEVCNTAIEYMKDPDCNLLSTLLAPDFPTGGELIFNSDEISAVYESGRGSFKVRARWRFIKEENIVEIYEIPYSTTVEAIIDKVTELARQGKLREISDIRDETGLEGLKLAVDLKRGADPAMVMDKLFKSTPLCDSFSCNFNILIGGVPRVMGVREILCEWTEWRTECVKRRVYSELKKKKEKLHLIEGLAKILLDIDKAISIIRNTEEEALVIPNLMLGFGIDALQSEYVADIRLRNINREYILKRTEEKSALEEEIRDLDDVLKTPKRVVAIISDELKAVIKKHGAERKTGIIHFDSITQYSEEEHIDDYPVHIFLSREGYFKKITPQSLRMSGEQKYKESDGLMLTFESQNKNDLLVFSDRAQVYKCRVRDFEDTKASALGTYLPSFLSMDEGENVISVVDPLDYKRQLLFFFENGKTARVELGSYETKTNRKKLTGAYADKSPLVQILPLAEDCDVAVYSQEGRALIFNTAQLTPKTSRGTQGVATMSLKRRDKVTNAAFLAGAAIRDDKRYRVRTIPAAGAMLRLEDTGAQQLELEI